MKDRKVLLLNNISAYGLREFRSGYTITENADEAHCALVRSADMHGMEFSASLRAIARAGAGVNNIPLERCAEEGIVVMNTPGANANAVKELVICGLLLAARDITGGIDWVHANAEDAGIAKSAEKAKKKFAGGEISGKKIGVIGLGAIGVMVANICVSLGMEVHGYDPYISVGSAWQLKREVRHESSLDNIYEQCDYITIHIPETPDTKGMLNAAAFAKMKDGVKVLNFARATLVNEDDMLAALTDGKVSRYVCDFADPKTVRMPHTIITPHLGASTEEAEDNCAKMAVEQLQDFLDNGNIRHSVNYPDISAGVCKTASRLAFLHRNVPGVISSLTSILGDAGINIENMQNASRDKYAYTLIDICERVSDEALDRMRALNGMLRVRIVN